MPIPNFDENGFLPEGIHDCSLDEIVDRFGIFQTTDRRYRLCEQLQEFLMITNDKQLHQAVEQLGRMYRALTALRTEVKSVNTRQFAVMAEGPLDEIQRLQGEIDFYTGVANAEENMTEQVETHTGDLRAIDLDDLSFILRKIGEVQEIRCTFERDLLETAKEALDRLVQVIGSRRISNGRRTYATLHVRQLEVIEAQNSEKSNGKEYGRN